MNVTKDFLVNASTTTDGVDVDITQKEELLGNVALKAEATTGGVNFAIISGPESLLQSDNYPAGSNFNVSLETTTGGIDIDAKYTP